MAVLKIQFFQVKESKPPTDLVDLESAEQDELYRLCKDALDKSYDRLIKSEFPTSDILWTISNP